MIKVIAKVIADAKKSIKSTFFNITSKKQLEMNNKVIAEGFMLHSIGKLETHHQFVGLLESQFGAERKVNK
jgi:hypothetical protein